MNTLRTFLLVCAGTLLAGQLPAEGPHGPGHGHPAGAFGGLMERFDEDQDGEISRAEFDRWAEELFAHIDENGDQILQSAELPQPRRHGREHGKMHGDGRHHEAMGGRLLSHLADNDGDGAVTASEWQGFLDGLEGDAYGEVSAEKLVAMLPGHGPEHGERLTKMLDHDGDHLLEIDDLNTIFSKLDGDGDGDLAAGEIPGFRHHRRIRGEPEGE